MIGKRAVLRVYYLFTHVIFRLSQNHKAEGQSRKDLFWMSSQGSAFTRTQSCSTVSISRPSCLHVHSFDSWPIGPVLTRCVAQGSYHVPPCKKLAVGTSPATLSSLGSNRTQWHSTASHARSLFCTYSFGASPNSNCPSFHRFVAHGSYHVPFCKQLAVGASPITYIIFIIFICIRSQTVIPFICHVVFVGFARLVKHAA